MRERRDGKRVGGRGRVECKKAARWSRERMEMREWKHVKAYVGYPVRWCG
jgi:hypothetical protein